MRIFIHSHGADFGPERRKTKKKVINQEHNIKNISKASISRLNKIYKSINLILICLVAFFKLFTMLPSKGYSQMYYA